MAGLWSIFGLNLLINVFVWRYIGLDLIVPKDKQLSLIWKAPFQQASYVSSAWLAGWAVIHYGLVR